jgi:hypothetical protein
MPQRLTDNEITVSLSVRACALAHHLLRQRQIIDFTQRMLLVSRPNRRNVKPFRRVDTEIRVNDPSGAYIIMYAIER